MNDFLLPMLFHGLMKEELTKWDEQEASEGERAIADVMNKQVVRIIKLYSDMMIISGPC